MKTTNFKSSVLMAGLMMMGLTACGNNQNQNPAAYGQYGNQAGAYNNLQGGCVPVQNGTLGFTAQGAQMNSAIILAGTLPANSTRPGAYGQVTMGGGMNAGINQQGMIQYQPKVSSSGTLQITVSPQSGTMAGVVQLSQSIVYQLMAMSGGGYNQYPGQVNPQSQGLCVSSMSFDIVHTTSMGQSQYGYPGMSTGYINQALVYLTLGTGQTIGPIPFY